MEIKVRINRGVLKVGDGNLRCLVAGRFRTDLLPVFESLLTTIRREIVKEHDVGMACPGTGLDNRDRNRYYRLILEKCWNRHETHRPG